MNRGLLNTFAINGQASPLWVIRAAAAGAAAAIAIAALPTRITYASALADAAVMVTITAEHTIAARATGSAGASSSAAPTALFAGAANVTATATGNAAVWREIAASAAADATSTGTALTAALLGEAEGAAAATAVQAQAHIVFPGAASAPAVASSVSPSADVVRYATVSAVLASAWQSWGQASIQLNGNSYYNHDGFVSATAGCSGAVDPDKIKVIVTLGTFNYGNATGAATAHKRHPGAVVANASSVGAIIATRVLIPTASNTGTATSISTGTLVVQPTALGLATATHELLRAWATYRGSANAQGGAVAAPIAAKRTTYANSAGMGTAFLAQTTFFGIQHWGLVQALAGSVGTVQPSPVLRQGQATGTATATAVQAYAVANSEIPAPAERTMSVEREERLMVVSFEDRLMVVQA